MPNITFINWHPDRVQPVVSSASMQIDFDDNTQIHINAETDISDQSDFIKQLAAVLFQ